MKPKHMTASKMTERITYKSKSFTQNEFNEPVVTWTDFATLWASIEPIRGREYFESHQFQSEITHRIRHLTLDDIEPTMEIHFGSRVFEILAFWRVEERAFEMEIMAKERL